MERYVRYVLEQAIYDNVEANLRRKRPFKLIFEVVPSSLTGVYGLMAAFSMLGPLYLVRSAAIILMHRLVVWPM